MNAAKKHWKVIAIAVVAFTVGGALAASGSSSGSTVKTVAGPTRTVTNNVPGPTVTQPAVTVTKTKVKVVHAKPKPKPQPTSTGSPTVSQQNAVRSAQEYLQTQAFSQAAFGYHADGHGFARAHQTYVVTPELERPERDERQGQEYHLRFQRAQCKTCARQPIPAPAAPQEPAAPTA